MALEHVWRGKKPPPSSTLRGANIVIYLDPLTRDTGCLRVISGSHIMLVEESGGALNSFQDYLGKSTVAARKLLIRGKDEGVWSRVLRPPGILA